MGGTEPPTSLAETMIKAELPLPVNRGRPPGHPVFGGNDIFNLLPGVPWMNRTQVGQKPVEGEKRGVVEGGLTWNTGQDGSDRYGKNPFATV